MRAFRAWRPDTVLAAIALFYFYALLALVAVCAVVRLLLPVGE